MKTILLIDGENFRHKVETILKNNGRRQKLFTAELLEKVFEESLPFKKYNIVEKRYYCAKIRLYQETRKQSLKLIAEQRRLKTFLFLYELNVEQYNFPMYDFSYLVKVGLIVYWFSNKL